MKGSRKLGNITICIFLFVFIFNMFTSNVMAAVNTSYSYTESNVNNLDDKVVNSKVLNVVGKFVYALASIVEKIVGDIFEKLTGDNMFPWSDRIIFNTIPFLDINFLNPSSGSLFLSKNQNMSMLASIVRDIYFTLFFLAIGFLGVVVAVMAMKLAISTIAAEKAQYKKAMVNWIFAIIMIFTVHIIISLVFYINEKFVEVASSILKNQIIENNVVVNFNIKDSIDDKALVENFIKDQTEIYININPFKIIPSVLRDIQNLKSEFGNLIDKIAGYETPEDILNKNVEIAAYFLRDQYYRANYINLAKGNDVEESGIMKIIKKITLNQNQGDMKSLEVVAADVLEVLNMNDETYNKALQFLEIMKDTKKFHRIKLITDAYRKFILKENDKRMEDPEEIISNMAEFFKENVYTVKTDRYGNITGWTFNNMTLQGVLLYTIFITQSILFFFAYIKRFFYVIVLSLLAPLVVIYDFLGKAVS